MKRNRASAIRNFIVNHCTVGERYTATQLQNIYDDMAKTRLMPFKRDSIAGVLRVQADRIGMVYVGIDYETNTDVRGRKPFVYIYKGTDA